MLSLEDAMAAARVMIRDLPFLQAAGAPAGAQVPPAAVKVAQYMMALHLQYAARQRGEGKRRCRRWAKGQWE